MINLLIKQEDFGKNLVDFSLDEDTLEKIKNMNFKAFSEDNSYIL